MDYFAIIGIEVHVELKTKSKMFCGCDANYFGAKPNTHCCPVCLGLPGALPVPNKKAIDWCIQIGQALNCTIPLHSKFDRKNYFYPDLPKGYQISQYDEPFAIGGWLKIKDQSLKTKDQTIRITRVHMEEDTAKLLHQKIDWENYTLIDFNRSGVPLVEIVTEPDIHSAEEAKEYLKKLQQLIRYLGVSDADMEKGSMRCEPNISIWTNDQRPKAKDQLPDYKVEIKNINSFKFAGDAIDYEIKRQYEMLTNGEKIKQETRRWDENKKVTYSQRDKEEAKDYRYFPEADIPPFIWTEEDINKLKETLPLLPEVKLAEYLEMGIPEKDATILVEDRVKSQLVDEALILNKEKGVKLTEIINAVINKKVEVGKISGSKLIEILLQNKAGKISDSSALTAIIIEVIKENNQVVVDYKNGKEQALGFLIGQIMKKSKGQADPQIATQILLEKLRELN